MRRWRGRGWCWRTWSSRSHDPLGTFSGAGIDLKGAWQGHCRQWRIKLGVNLLTCMATKMKWNEISHIDQLCPTLSDMCPLGIYIKVKIHIEVSLPHPNVNNQHVNNLKQKIFYIRNNFMHLLEILSADFMMRVLHWQNYSNICDVLWFCSVLTWTNISLAEHEIGFRYAAFCTEHAITQAWPLVVTLSRNQDLYYTTVVPWKGYS